MKLSCAIVQDLLPLYEEELCSPESREAVRAHLAQCPHCAGQTRTLEIEEFTPDNAEKAVSRSFRKVRRRWIASILLVLFLLPMLVGVGYLGWNEYHKEGICFSNLDEIKMASDFAKQLEKGQYEKAANRRDYSMDYESIQDALSLTWQDNLPNVQRTHLEDTVWMADPQFIQMYWQDTAEQTWLYLIYNGADRVLIPTNIFKAAVNEGASDGRWNDTLYYETGNGYIYAAFQTPWGSFMVEQNSWSQIMEHADDPVMLCYDFDMYPAWLYDQNQQKLEEYAKQLWQTTQDWNAPYRDMSLQEYSAFQVQEFVQQMQSLKAQGISVEYAGVNGAYQIDGEWIIQINMSVFKAKRKGQIILDISIQDGRLHISGGHNAPNAPRWVDQFWNAL